VSASTPSWAEELGAGLTDEGAPEGGRATVALLVLLVVFAAGLVAARQLPERWVEAERAEQETPQEQLTRRIQEALDAKAAGRYQDAWDALRVLHDADVHEPRVNLELAVLHEQIGNPDFASEYLALVEERAPTMPRVGLLRAKLEVAAAHRLHQEASRVDVAPGRALELIADARASLDLARERRPAAASLEAPNPVLRELVTEIRRADHLIRLKEAKVLAQGTEGQRTRARKAVSALLAEDDVDAKVREQVLQVRDHLVIDPVVWRSGS
jgi:hypothetical protein